MIAERIIERDHQLFSSGSFGFELKVIRTAGCSPKRYPFLRENSPAHSDFGALSMEDEYNGAFFRKYFSHQVESHPCHVHVVGMVFVKAGIAKYNKNGSYFILMCL